MSELRRTRELVTDHGWTHYDLRKARQSDELVRVRRGSYIDSTVADARQRHLDLIRATLPEISDGSVVSHASAAAVHGIPVAGDAWTRVWATRPGGGNGRIGPVLHLRRCRLDDAETTVIDGIPVTSLERTAVDLARGRSQEWGVIACDAAAAAGADLGLASAIVASMRKWPGAKRAAWALAFVDPLAQSPLESISRLQMHRLGFPVPITQFPVYRDGVLVATCDFGWEGHRLVGECDGKFKYADLLRPGERPEDAVMREKHREERIRGAGYWISRWSWHDAWHPDRLRSILTAGFASAPHH